jgi:hypothetical protein
MKINSLRFEVMRDHNYGMRVGALDSTVLEDREHEVLIRVRCELFQDDAVHRFSILLRGHCCIEIALALGQIGVV